MPTPFDLNKKEFFSEWEKRNSSNSKFDFCVSSLNGASSELEDIIFGKIVNLEHSSLTAERKSACESLFQKNLSNTDPEIRAWIPLGIMRWGFNNLVDQVVELSEQHSRQNRGDQCRLRGGDHAQQSGICGRVHGRQCVYA